MDDKKTETTEEQQDDSVILVDPIKNEIIIIQMMAVIFLTMILLMINGLYAVSGLLLVLEVDLWVLYRSNKKDVQKYLKQNERSK